MHDFKKKKKNDEKDGMSPVEKDAKMGVLGSLKSSGESDMLSKLRSMKGGSGDGATAASATADSVLSGKLDPAEKGPDSGSEMRALADKMSDEELDESISYLQERKNKYKEDKSGSSSESY